ncbi:MAG: ISL3 family transposase [Terriglobia bacterium]
MSHSECMDRLGGWEGYRVTAVEWFEAPEGGGRPRVWIALEPMPGRRLCCGRCGGGADAVHDVTERWVRDLPLFDAETWLQVRRCRVWCPACGGPTLEGLSWLAPYARVTQRLGDSVARLCQVLALKHVAAYFGLGWDQVKAIDKAFLARTLGPVDLMGVEVIAMDEFAIQKGHRYATVVVEPHSRRVLWVGRGRGRQDVRPFFQLLGQAGCERLRAVAMDMHPAYELEVRLHCPRAAIVYDLFHVVAKYGREVIDRVRVDEANRWRHDRSARQVIKGARWLLLRNRENIAGAEDRVKLRELLRANRKLLTVYVLKDDLKHLWAYRYPGAALRFWHDWYSRAIRSRIQPLAAFARKLKGYLCGILAHCQWPLHTSLIEGINNKIKVIKRMAYGFRDDDYFFLKIRAAFPGNAG